MAKFKAVAQLMSDDVVFLKEVLYNTRWDLVQKDGSYYYAFTYGDSKSIQTLPQELDSELASLGVYVITLDIYRGV